MIYKLFDLKSEKVGGDSSCDGQLSESICWSGLILHLHTHAKRIFFFVFSLLKGEANIVGMAKGQVAGVGRVAAKCGGGPAKDDGRPAKGGCRPAKCGGQPAKCAGQPAKGGERPAKGGGRYTG